MSEQCEKEEHFGYHRLSEREVINAVKEIKAAMEDIQLSWDEEVAKYEQTANILTATGIKRLARRNYPNKDGLVDDVSLFPYHSACYSLLDAYDLLEDGYQPSERVLLPILPEDDDKPSRLHGLTAVPPSYLPSARDAVSRSLQALSFVPQAGKIALKLLKHSMSDMQCDHELSARVIEFMIERKCFRDIDLYRRLLAILLLERRLCNGHCYSDYADDADHFCESWQFLEQGIGLSLVYGSDEFTTDHANLLCAFFKMTLDIANPSAGEKEDEVVANEGSSNLQSRKSKLKQTLYLWNQTDFDEEGSDSDDDSKEIIPYQFMCGVLECLSRSVRNKRHLHAETSSIKSSFSNAVGALVYIGEASVRRLPAKSDSIEFCSKIVFSFLDIYAGHAYPSSLAFEIVDENCRPVCGQSDRVYSQEAEFPSLINPNRYADLVNKATTRFLTRMDETRAKEKPTIAKNKGILLPPKDVFDVVRSLYGRDLVEVRRARCGYGDFFAWLGGEITAHDPFLYVHTYNFPEDVEEETDAWIADETERKLLDPDLYARYDFTLLKLLQAWNSPWTPDSHHSFQPRFRAATRTLMLCANRVALPTDVVFQIVKFLPRTAWPDERARCWCDDCAVENAVSLMTWKLGGKKADQVPKLHVTKSCACHVAMYKSSEHRKKHAGQHRNGCNKVPLRLPGHEERMLCQVVDAKMRGEEVNFEDAMLEVVDDDEEDDGDEGSWESMDTDDEEDVEKPQSITDIIFAYFNRKSYKLRETEESAFEAMYVREE